MAGNKYMVYAVSMKPTGERAVTRQTDQHGGRWELIDVTQNEIFEGCGGPWAVEDRYETFWNRLNDSWERAFPEHKDKVKVLQVVPVPDDFDENDGAMWARGLEVLS